MDGETAFRKSLKSVDSSLSAMKSELKAVSSSFDESTDAMYKNQRKTEILTKMQDQLKVKYDALSDAVNTSTKEYEDAKKKAEELTAEYGENSDKAKIAWAEVETLGNKMDRMSTMANNAQSKLNDVTQQLRNLETPLADADKNADDAADAFEDVGKAAEDAGNGGFTVMKGAAAKLVSEGLSTVYDSLKDIATEFGSMDSVYNNFAIKTGASAKEMEGYSESIINLYKEGYSDSLDGVANGMAIVKQTMGDIPTDQLEEVTEYAITLEETLGYDVAESMRTVNTLADQFGVAYSDAFDLIIQGAQNGLDQNGDLLDVINEYSVQFKSSGYGAEDMFNMLANGAATGVWSVDKLGDAWKEFNIRLNDGTADEALQALGLGFSESAADAELMERAAFNVSKAEVDLAKAHVEAAEVLAESGESSLEYQEALNNVTQAEYDLADAEMAYNEAANATSYNLDEIKGKLAAGGETAQEAQQQIITALMGVEDENERYILGQQLMGTMWEDLGEDAINALFDTQGEISATKDSMQEVIDLKYEDIGSKLEKVGRKAKTEIVEPLVEKALPKIEDGIEWLSDNLDDLIPTIETVGTVVVTAFAAKKVYDFGSAAGSAVSGFVGIVKSLTTVTTAQTAAQTALNATNPWGWVTLAVAGVGALTAALVTSYESYDDLVGKYSALSEEEQELRDKTNDMTTAYNDWKTARDNVISDTNAEFTYYDGLWDELHKIVDENGKIKTGYEERATFITSKLGDVTGEEIQIIDGVVQKYDELKTSISNLLEIQKAETILNATESHYNEAIQQLNSASPDNAYSIMLQNQEELAEQERELADAKAELNELEKMDYLTWAEKNDITADAIIASDKYYDTLRDAQAKVAGLSEKYREQIDATQEAEEAYAGYITTVQNYEGLSAAIMSGETLDITQSLTKLQYGFKDCNTATRSQLQQQTDNYKKELSNLENAIRNGVPGVTGEQVYQMRMLVNQSEAELAKADEKYYGRSQSSMNWYAQGITDTAGNAQYAAGNVANAVEGELRSGTSGAYNAGWDTGESYSNGLREALSNVAVETDHGTMLWAPALAMGSQVPQFASGVDNFRGGFAIINENNKGELVNLPNGSQVIPHDISMKYAEEAALQLGAPVNNFGGITVQINNPSLSSGQDIKLTASQLSETLISEISRRIDSQKRRYSSAVGR